MGFKETFTREKASEDPLGYDDAASYYFGCCVIFCIVIPWTYFFVKQFLARNNAALSSSNAATTTSSSSGIAPTVVDCRCSFCVKHLVNRKKGNVRNKAGKLEGKSWFIQLAIILSLWLLLGYILWMLSGRELTSTFDPYEVLEVTRSSTARDIRKAYRTLSLRLHPDRNQNDQQAAAKFMLVTKAYNILTNDRARYNYERYGNPDGPGFMKIGIGLPQFLIKKENQLGILLVFFFFLLIVVPTLFIIHHRRTSRYAPNGLRYETVQILGSVLSREFRMRQLLELVAASAECKDATSLSPEEDKIEIPAIMDALKESEKSKQLFPDQPLVSRNFLLLHAQSQGKRDLLSPRLITELDKMLTHVDLIAMTMIEIAAAHKWNALQTAVVEMLRNLVQSRPISAPLLSLLQVPHFNTTAVSSAVKGRHGIRDMRGFLDGIPGSRKGTEGFTPEQLADVEEFCRRAPRITLEASVGVEDEEEAAEGDAITITVKLTRLNLKEGEEAGLVHCPHWPLPRKEQWLIVMTEAHAGAPIAFIKTDEPGREVTVKAATLAPSKGKHSIRVAAMSDSYAGLDAQAIVDFKGGSVAAKKQGESSGSRISG